MMRNANFTPTVTSPLALSPPPTSFGTPAVSMDYSQFVAKGNTPPVVMFIEMGRQNLLPGAFTFFESMRRLGHDLRVETTPEAFKRTIDELKPPIICFSDASPLETLPLIKEIRERSPDAVMIAGGSAVVPEYALAVDYAVVGNGAIVFPKLLNFLYGVIARDGVAAVKTMEVKERSFRLGAARSISGPDGRKFRLHVPLGERLIVSGDEASAYYLGESRDLENDRKKAEVRWAKRYPDTPFPLSTAQFKKAVGANAQGAEIDTLITAGFWPEQFKGKNELVVTSQFGCWGDCMYCGDNANYGERGTVEHELALIAELKRGVESGRYSYEGYDFGGPQFIQNTSELKKLLDGIEAMGSYDENGIFVFPFSFSAQFRVDSRPFDELSEIYLRMKKLKFAINFGVERFTPRGVDNLHKVLKTRLVAPYVAQSRQVLRMIASHARECAYNGIKTNHDFVNVIVPAIFDTPLTALEEMVEILELTEETWNDFGFVPTMNFNTHSPMLKDKLTTGILGNKYAQIEGLITNEKLASANVWLATEIKGIYGGFFAFQKERLDDTNWGLSGVFSPQRFVWPKEMTAIFRPLTGDPIKNGGFTNNPIAFISDLLPHIKKAIADFPDDTKDKQRLIELCGNLEAITARLNEAKWAGRKGKVALDGKDAMLSALDSKLVGADLLLTGKIAHLTDVFYGMEYTQPQSVLKNLVESEDMAGIFELTGTSELLSQAALELMAAIGEFRASGQGSAPESDAKLVEKFNKLKSTVEHYRMMRLVGGTPVK